MKHVEKPSPLTIQIAASHYMDFLKELGIWEMMNDETRARTPIRVVESYLEFFGNDLEPINFTTFPTQSSQLVIVRDIDFAALCAHHHLPFVGKCHVGYFPNGKVVGLSKIARVVEHLTHGALIQEEVTDDIANYLSAHLDSRGAIVVMEAIHSCMCVRGVLKPGSSTVTMSVAGCFVNDRGAVDHFLALIKH